MTSLSRHQAADAAFNHYVFGAGIVCEGRSGWAYTTGGCEWVAAAFVAPEPLDGQAETQKLTFTVRFAPDSSIVMEAYAIDAKGQIWGRSSATTETSVQQRAPADASRALVTNVRPAGPDHQVLTIEGGPKGVYRRQPCPRCPWRVDATGVFPAEAFRHSASTSYDMASNVFGCHEAGKKPATCAGFLLRGAEHNLAVRLGRMNGSLKDDVSDGGHELHADYRAMAVANGVDPGDEVLRNCR